MSLVSIITPAYNAERFLEKTMQSVLAQTYANWEMLVVDDGSKDGTAQVAQRYAEKDERIRFLTHPGNANRGVSATRNLALEHAKGKWVAFLDSDDLWVPYKLELQIEQMTADQGIGFVFSKAICIDERDRFLADNNSYNFFPMLGSCHYGKSLDVATHVRLLVQSKLYMPCLTAMIAMDVVKGLRFHEGLRYQVEDHLYFTLAAARTGLFHYDAPLAYYRVHPNSYTTQNHDWKNGEEEFLLTLQKDTSFVYQEEVTKELNRRQKSKNGTLGYKRIRQAVRSFFKR